MKTTLLELLVVAIFILAGCQSAQQKAFEQVKNSSDLNALREFSASFGDSLEQKVKIKYDALYQSLELDSTLASNMTNGQSTLEKYEAACQYVSEFPNGTHKEDALAIIEQNKEKAEQLLKLLGDLKDAFSKYKFNGVNPNTYPYSYLFDFSEPDNSGKGTATLSGYEDYVEKEYLSEFFSGLGSSTYWGLGDVNGIVKRKADCNYSINDDLKIVINIIETRTYKADVLKVQRGAYGASFDYPEYVYDWLEKEMAKFRIKQLQKEYPSKVNVRYYMTLSNNEGFPFLSGLDKNGEYVYLTAVPKE